MIAQAQLTQLKTSVDLLDLTGRYTMLRKIASCEYAGPCPNCKGTDRFHVNTKRQQWMCRNCTGAEKWGDAIDFVRFVEGCDFVAACQRLGANDLRPAAPIKPKSATHQKEWHWQLDTWQQHAGRILQEAAARLDMPEGEPGRAYLHQRGIDEYTWRVWLLGYAPVSPPWSKEQKKYLGGRSITMPWLRHDNDIIMAIRYRRLNPAEERYTNQGGSNCLLYGLHQLDLGAHTLVIVEGELNCISIWHAARDLGVCVVSIGSQSISEVALRGVATLSQRYPRCLVWCDEPENALKVRGAVQSAAVMPLQSPKPNGDKIDANDMLLHGLLRAFIERKLNASAQEVGE